MYVVREENLQEDCAIEKQGYGVAASVKKKKEMMTENKKLFLGSFVFVIL